MSLQIGSHLGRYELVSLLGAGGMGEVYLARDTQLDRPVALKLLLARHTRDPERLHRFIQEAKAVSALNHPNIITIYEIGEHESAQFIATEYIDGRTLRQHFIETRVRIVQALDIVTQAAGALAAAHDAGIVHRDIKPENLMLRRDGYVKVLDFGLAKLTEKQAGDKEGSVTTWAVTEPGMVIGTPSYMSPEQARGLKVDGRSDIFSLGVVLYEIVAGRPPFEGVSKTDVIVSILDREPPPLARYAREVPEGLEWIVSKALAKERDERYQVIRDMLLDLKKLRRRLELQAEIERSGPPELAAHGPAGFAGEIVRHTPLRPVLAGEETSGSVSRAPSTATLRVALLYKRHSHPDEELLRLLETELAGRGHEVFVDRQLMIGVEWAREIERQVRTADAVIPLLSASSVGSEMLAYEVQIASEAAQQQHGKPGILPVRINFEAALPEPLASVLDRLHYSVWKSPDDDIRLVGEIVQALAGPARSSIPPRKLEPLGGAVPLDSEFYIVRPTDDEFRLAIARRDSIVLVKGARQMGKTSLLARGLQAARAEGAKVVFTDFQKLNAAHLESVESFFIALAGMIATQLDLDVFPEEVWNSRRGPSINFERYLRREILGHVDGPIIWGLDEVDRLFTCSFGGEVFGLFRSWHNERALDPGGPWHRLTLAIAYATEAHLFITDMNQSPFNVGTRLALEDFTFEQVAELNRRYGSPLRDRTEIARFFRLVGGQPYLVRRGLHELAARGADLTSFEAQADRDEGPFGDHLRRILVSLAQDPTLCAVVRGILQREPTATAESFYRLRSAGLISGDSIRDARPRCQLYAIYLERHLLEGA